MKSTVKLPRVAETVDEVIISEIEVEVGTFVSAGDVLMLVETDKALVEVPSPISGTVVELLVAVDDEVGTGHPIIVIESA
jgi:Pyruvate/2-oxoglutarate dehydrogenase complex, dihydrolipoamide acyltransferase (E2) component, and related enzymes